MYIEGLYSGSRPGKDTRGMKHLHREDVFGQLRRYLEQAVLQDPIQLYVVSLYASLITRPRTDGSYSMSSSSKPHSARYGAQVVHERYLRGHRLCAGESSGTGPIAKTFRFAHISFQAILDCDFWKPLITREGIDRGPCESTARSDRAVVPCRRCEGMCGNAAPTRHALLVSWVGMRPKNQPRFGFLALVPCT